MSIALPADWDWKKPNYGPIWEERARRLERIRQPGFDLAALKAHYADPKHWPQFISDWMCTFDPRLAEIGVETIVPFVLFPRQEEFIHWAVERWLKREDGLVEKSRDMGLSWLSVALSVCMWLFKPGIVFGFGSRKELYVDAGGNPASLFWKIRQAIALLPVEFRPEGYVESVHAPAMRITNPENGSVVVGEAGANIGRGNRTAIYCVDEAAFLEQPELVEAALSQTTNCRLYVSTPNGMGNPFARKRYGGKIAVFVFDWRDDPRKDQDWYDAMKAKLDPVVMAQEVDRDYSASVSNSFIPGKIVSAARSRGPADVTPYGPVMWGLDVARFGDDKSVLTRRQGRVVTRMESIGKVDLVDLVGWAKNIIMADMEPPAQIAVDTIGLGAGAADMLRRHFPREGLVVDVNSSLRLDDGEHYNLRARMWSDMRAWLQAGASIPTAQELETDLSALRYHYRGALLLIESKEEAKKRGVKSPDFADSLALTFAYPPKRAEEGPSGAPSWDVLDPIAGY